MRYLLDTNVCIALQTAPTATLLAHQRRTPASKVRLCSVVKAELLYGA